jgi:exosortase E/protease (VPEID-CTERM system)
MSPAPSVKRRFGLISRLAILGVSFLAEKIFLNIFVDFERVHSSTGLGSAVRAAQHWGFRFLVAFLAALVLLSFVRGDGPFKTLSDDVRAESIRLRWLTTHTVLVLALALLTYHLYRYPVEPATFASLVALWILTGSAAAISAGLAVAPSRIWLALGRMLGLSWFYAAIAAVLATGAIQLAQSLWAPTAAFTFALVTRMLAPLLPTLAANPVTLVLRTDHFAVQISEVCSGLEGVGLMLTFCSIWLLYFRREYIFPRALILIPAGMVVIFGFNVLRIAALMLIGNAGFPGVAIYGFHSQAGWIAFITATCGWVYVSRRSTWWNRSARLRGDAGTENPTAAYLMPLIAILAAGILSRAMSAGFEYLYVLRALGAYFLLANRRHILALEWRFSWRAVAGGILVFIIWIFAARWFSPAAAMPPDLAELSPGLRTFWLICRCMISVLLIPIAEELAYRGYLMRRLVSTNFESIKFQSVPPWAVVVTAILFGLAHGTLWLPGIAAGLVFGGLAIRYGSIGEATVAHAIANALVIAAVLGWNRWELW